MGGWRGWHRRKLAKVSWPLLVFMQCCCVHTSTAPSIYAIIASQPNLTVLSASIKAAGLSGLLDDETQQLTLFAPSDNAYAAAMQFDSLTCTLDYYAAEICSTPSQLLQSTDLRTAISNLIVNGSFPTTVLGNGTILKLRGDGIQQVSVIGAGEVWLGNAPITTANIQASNGLIHILGGIPSVGPFLNESSITSASSLSNFGPFTIDKRVQMTAAAGGSLPTDIPGLIASYQRVRKLVDLPQGGLVNPMAISYNPTDMYRLFRSTPEGGYTDSEAVDPNASTAAGPTAEASPTSSPDPIAIGTTGGTSLRGGLPPLGSPAIATTLRNGEGSATASIQSLGPQSAQQTMNGVGEQGVVADSATQVATWDYQVPSGLTRPADNTTLAFLSVLELAALMEAGHVTSVELVQIFTARLKRYDSVLEAVVTYTTDLAMEQALAADKLLAAGIYLGPLHGIPYGLKDIIAVGGYPTTWGAPQFRNQYISENANVYQRLRAAGAVLIAKLATGEMAYDDVWWGGKVKNPWNIAEGSSGSSAGPVASVVAATVPFSVGSETEGSLMSPADTCGASAMRPSLGSIGRSWVMMLADSLDKLGPVCRSIADCAVIFDILRGQDDLDPTSRDAALIDPFHLNISQMTVGYLPGVDTQAPEVMKVLRAKGVTLKPFTLSYGMNAEDIIMNIMISEAAAHFDYWQRSGQDSLNRRQDYWPPLLRLARLIPAVEYIQAQRARSLMAVRVMGAMRDAGVDAFIANSTTELAMCNLVGIPTVSVPVGFSTVPGAANNSARRNPNTVGFFGWPNGEPEILALGMAWQNQTRYHYQQPPIDNVEAAVLAQCLPYSRCTLSPASLAPASVPGITIQTRNTSQGVADSG